MDREMGIGSGDFRVNWEWFVLETNKMKEEIRTSHQSRLSQLKIDESEVRVLTEK
jgi:hypothetical protein